MTPDKRAMRCRMSLASVGCKGKVITSIENKDGESIVRVTAYNPRRPDDPVTIQKIVPMTEGPRLVEAINEAGLL